MREAAKDGGRAAGRRGFWLRAAGFCVAAAAASVFFLDLCHLTYDCGCVSPWAGGAAHCNIRAPGPPDCPYCARPNAAYGALFAAIGAQGLICFVPGRRRPRPLARVVGALLAAPVVIVGLGAALGLAVGYWN